MVYIYIYIYIYLFYNYALLPWPCQHSQQTVYIWALAQLRLSLLGPENYGLSLNCPGRPFRTIKGQSNQKNSTAILCRRAMIYIYEDIPIYTHIILIHIYIYFFFVFFVGGWYNYQSTARQLGMQDNCRCIVLSPQETWPIIAQGRSQHWWPPEESTCMSSS